MGADTLVAIAAVIIGAAVILVIVLRDARSGADGGPCCGCSYGSDPDDCHKPAENAAAPASCERDEK